MFHAGGAGVRGHQRVGLHLPPGAIGRGSRRRLHPLPNSACSRLKNSLHIECYLDACTRAEQRAVSMADTVSEFETAPSSHAGVWASGPPPTAEHDLKDLRGCSACVPGVQVSANMLARVQAGAPTYNNSADIAGSGLRSAAKLVYYYLFATAYGAAGGCAQVTWVSTRGLTIRR